jgi:hypothetical protein
LSILIGCPTIIVNLRHYICWAFFNMASCRKSFLFLLIDSQEIVKDNAITQNTKMQRKVRNKLFDSYNLLVIFWQFEITSCEVIATSYKEKRQIAISTHFHSHFMTINNNQVREFNAFSLPCIGKKVLLISSAKAVVNFQTMHNHAQCSFKFRSRRFNYL